MADIATLVISDDPTPEGKSRTAVNYFILHRRTLHGLYACYFGSVAFADFGGRITQLAGEGAKDERKEALKAARIQAKARKAKLSESDREAIRAEHSVKFMPLIRRDKLDRILAEWKSLSSFRYEFATTEADEDEFGALAPFTEVAVKEIRFKTTVRPTKLGEQVESFFGQLTAMFGRRLKKSSVRGVDGSGNPKTLNLNKLVDSFGFTDMDEVRNDQHRVATDLEQSVIIAMMKEEAGERPTYFSKVQT